MGVHFTVITLVREPVMRLFVTEGNDAIVALGSNYLALMAFSTCSRPSPTESRDFSGGWEI